MTDRLHVVIATPLDAELVERMREIEPRLDIDHRPDLIGDGEAGRSADEQAGYESYVDAAEALFGVPDQSGTALHRTVGSNPGLRWVHTIPAGGGQQVKAARLSEEQLERVLFTTSAGVHAQPLAEFAVFGVMAGIKHLPHLRQAQARHAWDDGGPMGLLGETRVAVVGLGGIGRRTAEILGGLGVEVIGVHRHEVEAAGVARIEPVERLGDVVAEVDAIVMTLPGTDETRGMLSADALARADGLTVVNVGRGTTIDETALIAALEDGRVAGAVLDVFEKEPLAADSPLWDDPRVVISPHAAARSPHESRLIAELFARNATRLLDGDPLENRVNTREFY